MNELKTMSLIELSDKAHRLGERGDALAEFRRRDEAVKALAGKVRGILGHACLTDHEYDELRSALAALEAK